MGRSALRGLVAVVILSSHFLRGRPARLECEPRARREIPGSPVEPVKAILQRVAIGPEWRGQRDTTQSRFFRVLAVSVLIHAPLTPVIGLLGLMGLLAGKPGDEPPPADPITAIPIDLVADERPSTPPPAETAKPEPQPEPTNPAPDDPFAEIKDDDDPPPEPVAKPKPRPDAGAPDAGPADAGTSIGDPVAMAGGAGKIVDANANVRLIVFNDRIRNHPLGARIGTLLGGAEQWKDFFGPTGLDPIKDVDRILIAGPQLRKSADVVAVLRVNVPNDKLRAAVDALVQRDAQGGWLDAGVPAARLQADRAERLLVLPAPQILVMAPPSAEKHALSLGSGLKFPNPKGNEALTTFVVTPWRAFVGIPFEIPKSIKWVRMKITPTSDGGAVADLVAEDESPESAAKHAEELAAAIDKVTHPKVLGFQVVALLEPISLKPVGSEIHGSVVATPKQLARLLEAVSAYAKELAEEAARKAAAKAAKDGGAPGADSGASDGERPAKDGGARPSMADAGRD